ncbi:MAG: glucose-1-phosphate adenylyltransferase subunit GlgD [Oscillospiraceae bacterium]
MNDLHGIILAYHTSPGLRELVSKRTSASMPFCGRYRLIDFSLSSMQNAGVRDVGVIMRQDYQSLLDHIGSGKEWDMSRRRGGLRLLPPFGQATYSTGSYGGVIEALCAVESYIRNIRQNYVVLTRGNLAGNVDIDAALRRHIETGADITAVCTDSVPGEPHQRYVADENGFVKEMLYRQSGPGPGYASLEMYIMSKDMLVGIMERGAGSMKYKFHRDAITGLLASGGKIAVYVHPGYAVHIFSVEGYYRASMDALDAGCRADLFPEDRPVRTKGRSDVSTYYGEDAISENSLVADGCFIEGRVENCVVFRGARVKKGAVIRNSIVMQDTVVGEGAELSYIISDKNVEISPFVTLAGSPHFPLVLPKKIKI